MLTLLLAALLCYALFTGVGERDTIVLLCVGIVLGTLYTLRRLLPSIVLRLSRLDGGEITADDDPRNLRFKVYGPILLAALVIAGLLYWYYVGRHH